MMHSTNIMYFMEQGVSGVESTVYVCALRECINLRTLAEGKTVHGHMIKTGFWSVLFLQNNLVNVYAKCGSLEHARQLFDKMPERNRVSWTTILRGYAHCGQGEEALRIFSQMQQAGTKSDRFTFASVLRACASLAAQEEGKQVHGSTVKAGLESNLFVGSALVDMYAKCGNTEDARGMFGKLLNRDVVSWNAMITGYTQNGRFQDARQMFDKMPKRDAISFNAMIAGSAQTGHAEEALKLYCEMHTFGLKPDQFTFASVLRASAGEAALEQGAQLHSQIIKLGLDLDPFVGSALIDMYAKSGSMEDACRGFEIMPERNVVSWTAMIAGYAQHGHSKKALRLFEEMQLQGTSPNRITFVGVLSACCYLGLVNEGRWYFESMTREHGITPQIEHYACMVDMLGRAGLLNDAEDFINQMPFEPDAVVWRTLLGACRIHGNIEVGKRAAESVFRLKPQDASSYVLLSNIYAAAGWWDDVANVRRMMKERVVKKEPGLSWMKIKNMVHSFVVGDRSHPQSEEIYARLEGLTEQMKELGYVPDTNYAFHDIEEES